MENKSDHTPQQNISEHKADNKKWIIIVVVIILGLLFIKTIFSPENVAERMIEQASNGDYDVDIDDDGSMQIRGGDGEEMNIVAGKKASLPENWPSSIPVPSDANIEYSAAVSDGSGGESLTVTYETGQEVEEVVNFYQNELVPNGWTIEATIITGDGSMLSASKGDEDGVVINIADGDNTTTVVISVQSEGQDN